MMAVSFHRSGKSASVLRISASVCQEHPRPGRYFGRSGSASDGPRIGWLDMPKLIADEARAGPGAEDSQADAAGIRIRRTQPQRSGGYASMRIKSIPSLYIRLTASPRAWQIRQKHPVRCPHEHGIGGRITGKLRRSDNAPRIFLLKILTAESARQCAKCNATPSWGHRCCTYQFQIGDDHVHQPPVDE